MTIIPQIDRYPLVRKIVQTPIGKLVLLSLFGVGMWIAEEPFWWAVSLAVAFVTVCGNRIRAIAFANVAFWIFMGSMSYVNLRKKDAVQALFYHVKVHPDDGHMFAARAGIVALFITVAFLLAKIYRIRPFNRISPVILLFALFCGCLLTMPALSEHTTIYVLFWMFTAMLGKAFWYLAAFLKDGIAGDEVKRISAMVIPFWTHNWTHAVYVPTSYPALVRAEVQDSEKLALVRLRGLKLLLWCIFLKICSTLMMYAFFMDPYSVLKTIGLPSLEWSNPIDMDIGMYNHLGTTLIQRWITCLVLAVNFFLVFTAGSGAVVSTVRMAGYDVFRQVYRPQDSKSFTDFLHRVYYYYIEILLRFLFYPIWDFLRVFRLGLRPRKFLTSFLTIALGGVMFSFLRELSDIARFGVGASLLLLVNRSPYFIALGTVCGISSLFPAGRSPSRRLPQQVRVGLYFAIYIMCFLLQFGWRNHDAESHKAFLFSLLGLSS